MLTSLLTVLGFKPSNPLKSLHTMQDAYEHIRNHFKTQKVGAYDNETGTCKYKTPSGLTCAVGCMISVNHYSYSLEGRTITAIAVQEAVRDSTNLDIKDHALIGFLRKCQEIHDSIASGKIVGILSVRGVEWLDDLANQYDLDVVKD